MDYLGHVMLATEPSGTPMPSAEQILIGLESLASQAPPLAVVWHGVVLLVLVAMARLGVISDLGLLVGATALGIQGFRRGSTRP